MTVILPPSAIQQAAGAIRGGGVAAIPTETVYGLAADPFQPKAVETLFRLKGRPENKPILLLVHSRFQAESLALRLPKSFDRLVGEFWPGPLTLIVPASPWVPERITAGTGTVALRMPGLALTRRIIETARVPLTGTSANRSGLAPAHSAMQVRQQFPTGLACIVDGGAARNSTPSTIVDLTGPPRIVREGVIPAEAVLCLC